MANSGGIFVKKSARIHRRDGGRDSRGRKYISVRVHFRQLFCQRYGNLDGDLPTIVRTTFMSTLESALTSIDSPKRLM